MFVRQLLQLIGTYAPELYSTPLDAWSTVATLIVVLMITCIKEGLEDIQRFKYVVNLNFVEGYHTVYFMMM